MGQILRPLVEQGPPLSPLTGRVFLGGMKDELVYFFSNICCGSPFVRSFADSKFCFVFPFLLLVSQVFFRERKRKRKKRMQDRIGTGSKRFVISVILLMLSGGSHGSWICMYYRGFRCHGVR